MAVTTINNAAVDNLRVIDFFDPDARFNYGTATELSLGSRDGYELVMQGTDFAFDRNDAPTDGTITDIFLYDPAGHLVGRIDDVSYSLETYYDTVAVGDRPGNFVADLLSGNDQLTGAGADDDLEGYGGNDRIAGGAGFDLLSGGNGNDTLLGESGNDDLYGDAGNDSLLGGSGRDLMYGGSGNDFLNGGSDNDRLSGGSGNDTIVGDSGNDELYGDTGNDLLNGYTGNDSISGGVGDDTLTGGAGRDVLAGDSGKDAFLFADSRHGADVILDFSRVDDVLQFRASGFENLAAGFDVVNGKDPTAETGLATFLFDTSSHNLFYDADGTGNGQETLIATLDDVTKLTRSDFLIT